MIPLLLMKTILMSMAAICMLLNVFPYQAIYPDVLFDNPYYDAIYYCYHKGYISGYADGSFGGEDSLSRAMAVTILYRMMGSPATEFEADYSDTYPDVWYSNALNWASEKSIILGHEDGSFRPGEALSRQQLSLIYYRLAGQPETELLPLEDSEQISDYAFDAVNWAASKGMLELNENQVFPRNPALRNQCAYFLYQYEENEDPDEVNRVENFSDAREFAIQSALLKKTFNGNVGYEDAEDHWLASGRLLVLTQEGTKLPNISAFHPKKILSLDNRNYVIQFDSTINCFNCLNYLKEKENLIDLEIDQDVFVPID